MPVTFYICSARQPQLFLIIAHYAYSIYKVIVFTNIVARSSNVFYHASPMVELLCDHVHLQFCYYVASN